VAHKPILRVLSGEGKLQFLGKEESEKWIRHLAPTLAFKGVGALWFNVENERFRSHAVAANVVSWLGDFDQCLLLITEYGIWPSSENLHLYYKLREAYKEKSKLHDSPGHLFEHGEQADLTTYLSLAIQFGWGGYLLPEPCTVELNLSHNGIIDVNTKLKMDMVRNSLASFSIPFHTH